MLAPTDRLGCHFFLVDCVHSGSPIFRPSYVRCQKTQGQKILRCFPHCCPGHVHYRNCGASLYLRTTHHMPSPLHVFGLFSLCDEDPYPAGTVVDASLVQRELRVPSNPRGSLVSAVRDEIIPNAFRFDEKELNGWQYSWKSGRSKAQRDLAHVFRVRQCS
ncbi:hypothetical protein SPRG_14066 [Saprolegnia parasitica CBS 223.65]|uniref:Uncharacterized protein n=1 Tax=Saprolegnia parasitica (strain CBS 223.65) TaxID=695850 RepID=A0A067BRT1_SAPPC|nr:hypothetical protein SPRG_14066 [Saprolegnia parasitica CBS 223.65]KDO20973.1 hypothetical protein SPRG_14066 [Saprolegnia parasitica CBS 223.65]|eukprot:XP_012208363.1 hypothetical protein SPRG_14066 [Saprolegnia parasitica CBS 223.65]